jgi:hypothetical protein
MPKLSRKARIKNRKNTPAHDLAASTVKEPNQKQSIPITSAPGRSTRATPRGLRADRQRQLITELKHIGLIAAILLALLIIISLLLR